MATGGVIPRSQGEVVACPVCGSEMCPVVTDLPFKTSHKTIVMLRDLPVPQADRCGEYVLEDRVMERVEASLGKAAQGTALAIARYAA